MIFFRHGYNAQELWTSRITPASPQVLASLMWLTIWLLFFSWPSFMDQICFKFVLHYQICFEISTWNDLFFCSYGYHTHAKYLGLRCFYVKLDFLWLSYGYRNCICWFQIVEIVLLIVFTIECGVVMEIEHVL